MLGGALHSEGDAPQRPIESQETVCNGELALIFYLVKIKRPLVVEWGAGCVFPGRGGHYTSSCVGVNSEVRAVSSLLSRTSRLASGFAFLNRDGRFRICTSFLNCCPRGFWGDKHSYTPHNRNKK